MHEGNGTARQEIVERLGRVSASVSAKYLYDMLGCRLFEAITCLPEYYLTRTEQMLMEAHGDDISRTIGTGGSLIYLGAGNCEKARALFPTLKPRQYVAVDFSTEFLLQSFNSLQQAYPQIDMFAVGADLAEGFELPEQVNGDSRVFFYPGSSIGNFEPEEAGVLLAHVRGHCGDNGGLLIGVDLIKDSAVMEIAYDDELGVTAAFNLNLLRHLNSLIGSDFRLRDWGHRAVFDPQQSRVEMHLLALDDNIVSWPGGGRSFAAGEYIHTENSYKYQLEDFRALLHLAGFSHVREWTDKRKWYGIFYASV